MRGTKDEFTLFAFTQNSNVRFQNALGDDSTAIGIGANFAAESDNHRLRYTTRLLAATLCLGSTDIPLRFRVRQEQAGKRAAVSC